MLGHKNSITQAKIYIPFYKMPAAVEAISCNSLPIECTCSIVAWKCMSQHNTNWIINREEEEEKTAHNVCVLSIPKFSKKIIEID